jgi:hypothetical protein
MKSQLNAIWHRSDWEVDLFRKMSTILSRYYKVTFIEEVHQKKINYLSNTIKITAVREIADLWIIAYSPLQGKAKMTFLQAKYHRGQLNRPGVFAADFFQYELLSTRPLLTGGGTYNFPLDILNFSCCDSVASYGIFYYDGNNQIDLAYSSASLLTNNSAAPATYGQHPVDLEFPSSAAAFQNCTCNTCQELNYTYDIDTFTNSLLKLEIGADIQLYPHILKFAGSVAAQAAQTPAIRDLISFIANAPYIGSGTGDNAAGTSNDGLPSHLLIINVDGNEDKNRQD